MAAPIQAIDISGFGFCGKSVVTDLFREVEGFHVPDRFFEFNLLRIQGGLLDLGHALSDEYSVIRIDAALSRFERLVKVVGSVARFSSPRSLGAANGMNYDEYFKGTFFPRTARYVDDLTEFRIDGVDWPYPTIEETGFTRFTQRALRNLRIKRDFLRSVRFGRPESFLPATRDYLDDLFGVHGMENVVLHNAFEPFDPQASIRLFHNAKGIIIDRDVRDIYVGALLGEAYKGGMLNRKWLALDDIGLYIKRQRMLYDQIRNRNEDPSLVLRTTFEDVILKYDETRHRIFRFLGVDPSRHSRQRTSFDPDKSKKNVGLWKTWRDQDSIREIERRLPHLCFQGIDR
jgi:hypothetical protein